MPNAQEPTCSGNLCRMRQCCPIRVMLSNQGQVLQSYTAAFCVLHMPTNRGGVYAAMRADVGRARRTDRHPTLGWRARSSGLGHRG